jgi:hypothetical protein
MKWDDMMQEWYYQDGPVVLPVKATSLDDAPNIEVIYNNYLRLES